jgi:tartrate-resistant acid phosphatase type 5
VVVGVAAGCGRTEDTTMSNAPVVTSSFAVIGDYGVDDKSEHRVSALVKRWDPDYVVTVGDNNYEEGGADTIDENVGKYFAKYIGGYAGDYGEGSKENRFWPSVGNHDWTPDGSVQPYVDYFDALPNNKRYYDFVVGQIHFFVVDSDRHEPDGITFDSVQGHWIQQRMLAATECFKVVVFHHPPFSSGNPRFTETKMRWPFREWGADLVMSGHQHNYERMEVDGVTYLIVGLGGADNRFDFFETQPGSVVRYNAEFGALHVNVSDGELAFEFRTIGGKAVDLFTIDKTCN